MKRLMIGVGLAVMLAGVTIYAEGIGFWLGYSGGAYKFSLGNPSGDILKWDGSNLTVKSQNLTIDSSGVRIAPNDTYGADRRYGFAGYDAGMSFQHYAIGPDTLRLASPDSTYILFTIGTSMVYQMRSDQYSPMTNATQDLGSSSYQWHNVYGTHYWAEGSQGRSTACTGDAIGYLEFTGGILTAESCTSPSPIAQRLSALEQDVAALKAQLAQAQTR
jgi:hypothetical protein